MIEIPIQTKKDGKFKTKFNGNQGEASLTYQILPSEINSRHCNFILLSTDDSTLFARGELQLDLERGNDHFDVENYRLVFK